MKQACNFTSKLLVVEHEGRAIPAVEIGITTTEPIYDPDRNDGYEVFRFVANADALRQVAADMQQAADDAEAFAKRVVMEVSDE